MPVPGTDAGVGVVISYDARQVVRALGVGEYNSVAAVMRSLSITRRRAKRVLAELVELAWAHRQRGRWELMPEGRDAATWYLMHGVGEPGVQG